LRIRLALLAVLPALCSLALAQSADDVQAGYRIAVTVCANCHVAAPDQPHAPIMRPPAVPLAAIARRPSTTAEWVRDFLLTTHRGLDRPAGMPNPELLDVQARQVAAYLMSLRERD
jgi:mono/diheme cytochrome c family protein